MAGWRFAGAKGQLVSVTAHSDVFNPQVAILFPDGERLAWDYGGGPGSDSHLVASLPATGSYVLDVAAVAGNAGPYELQLRAVRVEPLGLDTPVAGQLVEGTDTVGWRLTGASGQVFSVTARSDAFSPRLVLLGGNGEWPGGRHEGDVRLWSFDGAAGDIVRVRLLHGL